MHFFDPATCTRLDLTSSLSGHTSQILYFNSFQRETRVQMPDATFLGKILLHFTALQLRQVTFYFCLGHLIT